NGAAKAHVSIGITATDFRGDGDLAGEFAEKCTALGVERAFEAFNLGPFAVSRHEMGILLKTTLPDKLGSGETRNRSASKKNRYRGGKLTIKFNRVPEFLSRRVQQLVSCRILRPLPRGRIQDALPQPKRLGRHLDKFVPADVFDGTLETHAQGRLQLNAFPIPLA